MIRLCEEIMNWDLRMKGRRLCKVTRTMIGKREIRLDQRDERVCRHGCGRARGSKSGIHIIQNYFKTVVA